MADSGSEDEQAPQITITLKSTAENHQISIADNATIGKVKKVLSEKINQPVEKICLIFSGKILKDHETLKTYNINNGMAIHMVIRAAPSSGSSTPASRPSAAASTTTPSGGGISSTPTTTSSTPAAPTIPGMPAGMNMETARRLMDSPFMQQMMNNPEILRNMIGGNEHIQSLIRQNPEIGHLLNDPEIIRQTMEMIRNPNMFNEMMRNHDQAIRNLQGIPGGEAALQRLYTDIQEPLLNSANSGSNPFASNNDASAESRSQRAGVENAEALPNPWGSGGGRTAAGSDSAGTGGTGAAAGSGGGGMPNMANMLNNPALQSMMNSPEMQETMRSMMSNPEMLRTMMSPEMLQQARGLLGDNIGSNEEIARMAEQMSGLMGNPDVASSILNPRVMEAMNNIRTSIETIRTEAPGLFQQMFQGVLSSMNTMQNPGTTSASSQNTTSNTATDAAAGTGAAGANPMMNPQLLSMLGALSKLVKAKKKEGNPAFGGAAGGAGANIPPEERYRSQLDQLVGMGFSNRDANIRALQDTNGDVNAAIDRLLNN
uniref:Ubiquilin n=1 Tax=Panagrolaimus superbus TaxID=310955 RepID=A0A914YQC3_9BILA